MHAADPDFAFGHVTNGQHHSHGQPRGAAGQDKQHSAHPQKLPQRWLAGMQQLRHDQLPCRRTELGIATWVMTVMQASKGLLTLNDPMQATLLAAASEADPLLALLSVDAIFPAQLLQDQALLVRLREALTALSQPSTTRTFIAQLQG